MTRLVLVRHAAGLPDAGLPRDRWRLSGHGASAASRLAALLAPLGPTVVVTSTDLVAQATGAIVAEELDVPSSAAADLHEHERTSSGYLTTLEAAVEGVLRHPELPSFGLETGAQARDRFAAAVAAILAEHADGVPVVVAHGTVIALYVASADPTVDPVDLWRRLGEGGYVVLEQGPDDATLRVAEVVPHA